MQHAIRGFFGPHRFLSNFWYTPIHYEGITYPTSEHAFQAAKSRDPKTRQAIAALKTPGDAKRAGRALTLSRGWDYERCTVMRVILEIKFAPNTPMATKLLATGDAELVEENTWGDTFWGTDTQGRGWNNLGVILMEIRDKLRKGSPA